MATVKDTRIIFVHGLASKPPATDLHRLWRKSFLANIELESSRLASKMEASSDLFRSAYWANSIPDHIEDTAAHVRKLEGAVDAVISVRKKHKHSLHISKKGWAGATLKKFGLNMVDVLGRALTIKDDVIDEHMREVRLYRGDQYIADKIRDPLESELRDAWNNNKSVAIISHSMGTFIAYDVLWRFSHRSEPSEYREYRNKAVNLFITMGSPLGDSTIRSFMLIERWKNAPNAISRSERRRYFPTNIDRWFNFSAYGDVVCHDATLRDDFFEGLKNYVGANGKSDLRDYEKLYNPYKNVEGKPNPHKSYGYLIQPKLAQKIVEFFKR